MANNFTGLAKEMATGKGEHLVALAGMLGCPIEQQGQFNTASQRNYEAIFASDATSPSEILGAMKGVVASDAVLSAACIN